MNIDEVIITQKFINERQRAIVIDIVVLSKFKPLKLLLEEICAEASEFKEYAAKRSDKMPCDETPCDETPSDEMPCDSDEMPNDKTLCDETLCDEIKG